MNLILKEEKLLNLEVTLTYANLEFNNDPITSIASQDNTIEFPHLFLILDLTSFDLYFMKQLLSIFEVLMLID